MDSIGKECTGLKHQYDACFNQWYADKFLRGDVTPTPECEELFDKYRACVHQVLQEKGLDGLIDKARKSTTPFEKDGR